MNWSSSIRAFRVIAVSRIREFSGYRRSQEDTKKIQFEYRRNLADTTGHERTPQYRVRDREAPGSNPGPPTTLLVCW